MYFIHENGFTKRTVIPPIKTQDVLTDLHQDLGYAGVNKMEVAVRKRFWWPNLKRDVADFCRTCSNCSSFKSQSQQNKVPLRSIKSGFPNELIGVDIVGHVTETRNGNRYILVIIDFFTNWCEAIALRTTDSISVAK